MHTLAHGRVCTRASLLLTLTVALSACQVLGPPDSASADTGASSTSPSSADLGRRLYKSNCTWCHGDEGERGVAPLRDAAPTMEDEMLADIIVNGDKDKGMPAHASLSEEQVANLIAFIRSWQP